MQVAGIQQLAQWFGVSDVTVQAWQDEGMPIAVRGGPGLPHEYDSAECVKWYVAREMKRANIETPRDRLFKLQAEDLELSLAEKRGQLVPAVDLKPRLKAVVVAAREALRNEPSRLSGLMEGLDRRRREDLMREAFESFLRKLARLELVADGHDVPEEKDEDDDE